MKIKEDPLLSFLSDYSTEWYILVSSKQGVLYVSPSYERLTGRSPKEVSLSGESLAAYFHPHHKEGFLEAWDALCAGKEIQQTVRIKDGKGESRFFLHTIVPVYQDEERGHCVLITGRDITELVNVTCQLRVNEEKYRLLTEITTDSASSVIVREDGSFFREWTIDHLLKNYGYSLEEIDSFEKWLSKVHPDDQTLVREGIKRLTAGEVFSADFRIITHEGEIRWIRNIVKPVRDSETKMLRLVSSVKDITALKQIENELRESENKYRWLTENMEDIVARFDANLTLLYANKAIEQYFPLKRQDVSGKYLNEWNMDPEIIQFLTENIRQIFQHKEVRKQLYEYNHGDKMLYFNFQFIPEKEINTGKIVSVLVVGMDISQQKKLEKELIAAKEKAEESDRMKSVFLANMSHELRTPLNAIIGFASLMKNDNIPADSSQRYLEVIDNSARQLLALINNLLDISKIEAGKMEVFPVDFDLHQLLVTLQEQYRMLCVHRGKPHLSVVLQCPSENSFRIRTDEVKLQQVLNNLLYNAFKFTEKGQIEFGYTHCGNNSGNKKLCFYVKDTGCGIAEEKQPFIFKRFQQVDEQAFSRYEGTGLGLAISKGLVELMGGTIWFESIKNHGSVFYFTLPFEEAGKEEKNGNSQAGTFIFSGKTILVVDDVPEVHQYFSELLSATGASLLHAMNGKETLALLDSGQLIDLVLMDIRLPDISGIELTRMVKEKRKIPVIAQTAMALPDQQEIISRAGCDDILIKPVEASRLLFSLANFLLQGKKE